MSAQPIPVVRYRAFDANGQPLAGGLLYSFSAGTSTPLATYTTRAGDVANTNPVVLDANGEADVWLTSGVLYKFELRDSGGVLQWSKDNVLTQAEPGAALSTFAQGVVVTQSNSNANAIFATGNGLGTGVVGTGGATGLGGFFSGGSTAGSGVKGQGTGTAIGVIGYAAGVTGSTPSTSGLGGVFAGSGAALGTPSTNTGVAGFGGSSNAPGGYFVGGGTGLGGYFVGGASGGMGVDCRGTGTQAGGNFRPGTISSATTRYTAVFADNGDIRFGVDPPASNTAFTNTLTSHNTPRAWARIRTTGGGTGVTVEAGFNIASAVVSGTTLTVTLASGMTSMNYAAFAQTIQNGVVCGAQPTSATVFIVTAYDAITNASVDFQTGAGRTISVLVFGEQ